MKVYAIITYSTLNCIYLPLKSLTLFANIEIMSFISALYAQTQHQSSGYRLTIPFCSLSLLLPFLYSAIKFYGNINNIPLIPILERKSI
jgi:hypothetical protein